MNHYQRLGINRDATSDEIKRAFRERAKQTHPDKGGSDDEFAPIAGAYDTLMDPQRRLLYDATGKDQHPPIEKEVQQILLSLFDRVLDEPDDVEIVATVRETAKAATRKFAEVRKEIKVRQEKLKAKRGK